MHANTPSRIVAEVWDRYLLQVPQSDPVSRHRTVAAAHIACARANHLLSNPDGSYPTHDGQPPCVVYAVRTHDRRVEVEAPPSLSPYEEATVATIRGLVVLGHYRDQAVVEAVLATAADAHSLGIPYDQHLVLSTLYPLSSRATVPPAAQTATPTHTHTHTQRSN